MEAPANGGRAINKYKEIHRNSPPPSPARDLEPWGNDKNGLVFSYPNTKKDDKKRDMLTGLLLKGVYWGE